MRRLDGEDQKKGPTMTTVGSKRQKAGAANGLTAAGLKDIAPEVIDKLTGEEVLRLCRAEGLPTTVSLETARRQLKAARMGGREKYIAGGYTLCPHDGFLATVEETVQLEPPQRWMRCTGPRHCRFKR